jgi:gliding motility-associated-like protein
MEPENLVSKAMSILIDYSLFFLKDLVPMKSSETKKIPNLFGKFVLILSLSFSGLNLFSQTYDIKTNNGQTISTCSGTFYDSGGPGAFYSVNENNSVTFCSSTGENIRFSFHNVFIQQGDVLKVYDGPDASATLIGAFSGGPLAPSPVPDFNVTSSGTCLTFVFTSDASFVRAGWIADITCVTCTPPVAAPILPVTAVACAGATINYSVANHAGSTYNWTVVGGTPASVIGGTNSQNITWDMPGGITGNIRVDEITSCGTDFSEQVVDIYPLPLVDFSGLNNNYCLSNGPVALTGNPLGGTFSGPGISGNTFDPSSAGLGTHNIVYTYTDPVTLCSDSRTYQTTVSNPALFNVGASSGTYCTGGTGVDITLSGSEPGVTYQLLFNGTNDGAPLAGTGSPLTWSNKTAGTYTVSATITAISCTAAMSGSQIISTIPLPLPFIVGASSTTYCAGSGVTITLGGSEIGVNYQLQHDGINEDPPLSGTGAPLLWNNKTSGVYTIVATNVSTSCSNNMTGSQTITLSPSPTPSISGNNVVCPGAAGINYSTPAVVGDTYNWVVTGGTISGSGNSISVNWGAVGPGTVRVTETVTATGCAFTTPDYIVQINDVVAPVISGCPANIILTTAPGLCSASANWTEPTAVDNCAGAMTYTTRSHAPGSTFNSGVTNVTYTFTDSFGNTSSCNFTVTVNDAENPVALCRNISVTLDAFGLASITPAMVDNGSTDNCVIASSSVVPNSFTVANTGPNNVTLTITDNSGNISTCTSIVTVVNNNPPIALCKNITVFLNAAGNVSITGADVDNGSNDPDGIASLVVAPNTFTCANIGPNNVTLTVTDGSGKSSTCSSVVTVADNILPVVTCPGNWNTFNDPGVCGAVVNYITPVGTDNCSGSFTSQIAGFASGSVFPVGTTTNTFLVTDGSGNSTTCSFTVTVTDNESPVITLPAPPVINSGAGCQAPVPLIAATFSDNCTPLGSLIITQVPAVGTLVGTGVTIVTVTATDLNGNSSSKNINLTVVDGSKPVITTPSDITLPLNGSCQALVPDYLASLVVTDNCTAPGALIKTQTPAAGSVINGAASTNILIQVTDASGNTQSVTVLFITQDLTPPVMSCKNTNLYLDGSGNAVLNTAMVDNGSTDNCSGVLSLSLSKSSFSCSDIGAPVPVILTGTDNSLNSSTCTSNITVLDTIKPIVNVQPYNLVLNPVTGSATLLPANVDNGSSDNCGPVALSVAPSNFTCATQGTRNVILTVTDSHGNSRSKSVQITVTSTLSIDAMSLSSCDLAAPFASYKATVSGGNGTYSYFWDVVEPGVNPYAYFDGIFPFIHFTNTSTSATPYFNNLMPDGTYHIRLTVTDGNGCSATSQFVLVKSGLTFSNITKVTSTACDGDTKVYSVPVSAGATYSWNVTNGTFLSPTNTNTVTVKWTPGSASGLVVGTVTKTDLLGNSCGSSVENTVTINPLPTPVFSAAPVSVCSGSVATYTLSATYTSHAWVVTGGNITGGGAAANNFVTVTWGAGPAGNVSVTVTNASGCTGIASTAVTVNAIPVPTLSSSDADNIFCAGTSITFTATGGNNYNFRVNGISVQNSVSPTYTTPALTNGQVVDVIVTNINGCTATSAGITNTVIVFPAPTLSSSAPGNTFCAGTSVTFTATGGTNFNFRVNGISVQNSGAPTYTTSTLTNGQIVDVIVTNAGGCSSTSAGIANTVIAPPVPTISSSDADNSFCAGTSVTFTAGGGTNYNFRINGISVQNGASNSYTTTSLTNLQVIDVIVSNAGGCTSTSAGITNNVFPLPVATISSSDPDNIICSGTSVTFTAGGGTNYNFRVNGISVQNSASATYTTSTLTNGQIVDVIVSNAGGCTSTSSGITTVVTTLPAASISYIGTPFCTTVLTAQPVTLTGTPGGAYSSIPAGLSLNVGNGSVTPGLSTAGTYTVTYTIPAAGGCGVVTATTSVTITQVPVATFSYAATPYCSSAANPSPSYSGGGIAGTFSSTAGLVFISTATGQINLSASTPGNYIVTNTIAASGGCGIITSTSPITITALPTATISYAGTPFCTSLVPPQAVTLNGTGAFAGGVYSSTAGLTINSGTGAITPSSSSPGNYTVTYTIAASGGCALVAATTPVTITAAPSATISYSGTPFCTALGAGQPVTFTGTPGGIYSAVPAGLSIDPATGAINPGSSSVGAYTVSYSIPAGGGCLAVSATTPVTITGNPTASINYIGSPFCASSVGSKAVTLTGTGAYLGGIYTSTAGLTINSGTGDVTPSTSTPGTYIVTYTTPASGGCAPVSATASVTITSDNTITLTSAAGTTSQTVCSGKPIVNITYATTGASGATVSGLPAGVAGVWVSNVVTISGTPTVPGPFNYTVTLTGGCGNITAGGTITVTPANTISLTSAAGTNSQAVCINTPISNITYTTSGATGATFAGLPSGVTGTWAANTVTITGTPIALGLFNYTVTLTGGCGPVTANGTITVSPNNTIVRTSAPGTNAQTVCVNTPITNITYNTTGATGATFTGLPSGVTGNWIANVVTISGIPSVSGPFSYTVRLTGGCGNVSVNGTITVTPNNTITLTSGAGTRIQTVCINTPIRNITYSTTRATGATFSGLPSGVSGVWAANTVTISGTPTVSGPFNYIVTLTGGCGNVTANGTITVSPNNTITLISAPGTDNQTTCINTPIIPIIYNTTGAVSVNYVGLPSGVTLTWVANTLTISGTPNTAGINNYTVTLNGGCGNISTSGTITVSTDNTISLTSVPASDNQTVCLNSAITDISYATTGATGATFSGLPAGVTGTWAAGVATISGIPSVLGTFNFTIDLTGGCGNISASGTLNVNSDNTIALTSGAGSDNQTVCVNTSISDVTYQTTGATGATFTGLPAGVSGSWSANTVTISGTPSTSGTFNYLVDLTGGCGSVSITGTINVNPDNTITLTSAAGTDDQEVCINSPIVDITYSTTGATGAIFDGLPAGVSGVWVADVVTISGTPTESGPFDYSVTLTGNCGNITANGLINVSTDNTIDLTSGAGSDNQSACINSGITDITYSTTGATGATFSGLPAGVTGIWAADAVTISGIPTITGTANFTITLTGGCGIVTATGTISVNPDNTILLTSAAGTDNQIVCSNSAITDITYSTTGATDAVFDGLPDGVTGVWAGDVATISGIPTASGLYNYVVTLVGGCGNIIANGTIDVTPDNTISLTSAVGSDSQTACSDVPITDITYATTGATGAVITGLPADFTGIWSADVITISGIPSSSGIINYSITLTGGCGTTVTTGLIDVTPANSINLTSAVGTDNQVICMNSALTDITYTTTGATDAIFTGLPAGVNGSWVSDNILITGVPTESGIFDYTIELTGGCGTVLSGGQITVNADNSIALSSAAGTDAQAVCINTAMSDITYNTTGATGASFSGLPPGVTGNWAGDVVTISGTPTLLGLFNYQITLTGGCGVVTMDGSIEVILSNSIILTSAVGTDNQTVCVNTPIIPISYSTKGATGTTYAGLPLGMDVTFAANTVTVSGTPTSPGTYVYVITPIGGCGTVSATGTIIVDPDLTSNLSSATGTDMQTVCINSAMMPVTYVTTGVTTADFTGLPAGVTGDLAADIITISGTPTDAGINNYTVDLTGTCGTISVTGIITVNTDNTISITSAAGTDNQTICMNTPVSDITYSTTGATGASFTGLPTGVTGIWAADTVTISGIPTIAGVYNFTVTLAGGCGAIAVPGTINVITDNTITLTSVAGSDNQTVCSNTAISDITYSTTGATGATFIGLPNGITGNWASDAVTISGTPTDIGTFNYTISLTGGCGAVSQNGIITVGLLQTVDVSVTADANPVCAGTTVTLTALPVNGGTSPVYKWQVNGMDAGTNSITYSYIPANNDVVTVVLISDAGCVTGNPATSLPLTLTVNPVPAASVVSTNVACFGGTTGSVDLTVSGGTPAFNYLWNNGAGTEDLNNIGAGSYSVVITDANNCTASANAVITEPATALTGTITAQTDVTVYGGNDGSVTLAGSGGDSPYQYKLGSGSYQVSDTFTGLTAGSYIVTVQDINLCTVDIPVTISEPAQPISGSIVSQINVDCFGSSTGSVTVAGVGGLAPYEYKIDAGSYQSSGTFGALAAGVYTVTVRDNALNTFDVPVTITQPASALDGSVTSQSDVPCFGDNTGTITVTGNGGTSPYMYKLGSGSYQDSGTFGSLSAGPYTVTVQDAKLCTFDVFVSVKQPAAALSGTVTQTNPSCSQSSNGSVTVTGAGGTLPYMYNMNGGPYQVSGVFGSLIAGTYSFTVLDANLCVSNVSASILAPADITIGSTSKDASCPGVADGNITLSITGGIQPYNVIWSDGATTKDRTNVADGTYSVVVTDANGCASSQDVVVGVIGSENCLVIPDIITPNNDGYNDTWIIKNIDLFPNAEISVFTRWGKLVFNTKNIAANPWDGRYKGELLPTDSYHYVLHLNDGSQPRSGVISIIR